MEDDMNEHDNEAGEVSSLNAEALENSEVFKKSLNEMSNLMKNMKTLDIVDSVTTSENLEISRNQNLDELNMEFSNLSSVPVELLNLTHVRFLHMAHNLITKLPEDFGNLRNLIYLDLSHNKLKSLPKSLLRMLQLRYLNISYNEFSAVPDLLYEGLQNLKILNLSHNQIHCFNDPPQCADSVVEVFISHNSLKTIPKWMFFNVQCAIQKLDLSYNPLVELKEFMHEQGLSKFNSSIKETNFQNCSLSGETLHFLTILKCMETLRINNGAENDTLKNYLGSINEDIVEKCNALKHLFMSYVGISLLPSNFGQLQNIKYLDLSNNFLSWLPDSFCDLLSLKICNLSFNALSFLPAQFGKLTNLKELYISNNSLSGLPEGFLNLSNLEYADFYMNKLEYVDPKIISMQSLKGIDLEYNYLDFNELCNNEIIFQTFQLKYLTLKQYFRQRITECRSDSQILKISDGMDSDNMSSSLEEEMQFTVKDMDDESPFFSEMWDNEISEPSAYTEDDDFDPNDNYKSVFESKKINMRKAYVTNFCPGDSHVPSLMKHFIRNIRRNPDEYVEGQYDLD